MLLFLICLLMLASLALFVLFDCIVYSEYEDHPEDWNIDGKLGGFFWQPSQSCFWRGSMSRSRLASTLIFTTPDWVRADQRTSHLLFWYRFCWWILIVGWVASVVWIFAWRS